MTSNLSLHKTRQQKTLKISNEVIQIFLAVLILNSFALYCFGYLYARFDSTVITFI